MNISAPFIQRPIATALLMVGLLLGGLVTYRLLPVASLPNVNFPTIQVTAQLPGADPQTMVSSVATPLEQQFSQIPGVTQLTSASALGFTQLTVQFALSRDIDSAATDVLAAINAASPYLPQGIPYPPTIRKVNPADTPILVLGLTSDTLPLTTVDAYAESILLPKISQIPGVGLVGIDRRGDGRRTRLSAVTPLYGPTGLCWASNSCVTNMSWSVRIDGAVERKSLG